MQPFRFVIHSSWADDGAAWLAFARRAEDAGYAALYVPDHLDRQLSPIAALSTAAAVTDTLRLGPYVAANDFRHPLLLARELATLDVLSGGRVEIGLGAGWRTSDYRQLGLAYDRPGVRIDRLEESIGLLKRLFRGEPVTHAGTHYRLDRAVLSPAPLQRPYPPFVIGGGGPRMLRLAAKEADVVGIIPQFDARGRPMLRQATEAATEAKAALVREAAGTRWEQLRLDVIVFYAGLVGGRARPLESLAAAAAAAAVSLIGTPYALHGSLPRVRDLLLRRRERSGISQYSLPGHALEAMAPLVEALSGR